MKLYVASKLDHAMMWQRKREAWATHGIFINASWIDTYRLDNETTPLYAGDQWINVARDIEHADVLLAYKEEGDSVLRGALVEVGMALAWGTPICIAGHGVSRMGSDWGTWQFHPLVHHYTTIDAALAAMLVWKKTDSIPFAK